MAYHMRVRAGALIVKDEAVLLVEFNDENGLHYNLPAGGVDPNETIVEAVRREAKEEASIDIEVGPLAFVYEYAPNMNENKYGLTHSVALIFESTIKDNCEPKLPDDPDPNQTDVKWIKLSELNDIVLYPRMQDHIISYMNTKRNITIIEEHLLEA
ncbi:NUDIX domain-containing protein [Priestia taiwanensis]|uniref:NUDIX hydrolase n=1 Tax=Priestia taiwanensis TaxID=1347902 RepID=A0A917ARM0_9BACI|nr:NUDIX domain-containing protein [Priestia taiwanensis]MBM7363255.1 8-oxo-dGTP pyrophosphatase MutT (NUDIX family) [Priestia taiwanensis]GGE68923.1 NUDIX hydrolase [Priestia taiwanensis]